MRRVFSRVLIKDRCNNILVVQDRSEVWNFPGGKKEMGEEPKECAIREVREEVGLHVLGLTEISQGDFIFENINWHGHFYFADSVSGIPTINEMDKIHGIRFVNKFNTVNFPDELSEIILDMFDSVQIKAKSTRWI